MQPKIFSFSPKKKTFIFGFFFVIALFSAFSIPQVSYAWDWDWDTALKVVVPIYGAASAGYDAASSSVKETVQNFYNSIVEGISDVILWLCWGIASIASALFSSIISTIFKWKITTDKDFMAGWQTVKNLANMLIVLGFVAVGIATSLRMREYEAKKLLPKLIVIALLINFSGVFCGFMIDLTNLTMTGLLGGNQKTNTPPTSSSIGIDLMNSLIKYEKKTLTADLIKSEGILSYVAKSASIDVIYIVLSITLFYVGIMLIARYAILGILFVLSPLAFTFWIFPMSKKLWTKWWEAFIKWSFIGIGACFFINLSNSLIDTDMSLFRFFLVMIFMIVGMKIVTDSSGFGASAIIGLSAALLSGGTSLAMSAGAGALKAGGRAVVNNADRAANNKMAGQGGWKGALGNTLKWGGKGVGAVAGAGSILQKTRSGAGKLSEILGTTKSGTQKAADATRVAEAKKEFSGRNASSEELAREAAKGGIKGAAAADLLIDKKEFDKIDPRDRDAAAKNAAFYGVDKEKIAKARPESFTSPKGEKEARGLIANQEAIRYQKPVAEGGVGLSPEKAMEEAKKFAKTASPETVKAAQEDLRARKTLQNALGISNPTDTDVTNKVLEDKYKEYKAGGKTHEEALEAIKGYKPTEFEMASTAETLTTGNIKKKVQKMSGGQFTKDVNESSYSLDLLSVMTDDQIGTRGIFGRNGNKSQRDKIRALVTGDSEKKASDHLKRLKAEGKTEEYKTLKRNINLIKNNGEEDDNATTNTQGGSNVGTPSQSAGNTSNVGATSQQGSTQSRMNQKANKTKPAGKKVVWDASQQMWVDQMGQDKSGYWE